MKLSELVGRKQRMLAHCRSCQTDTLLDPRFFYPRRAHLDLSQLADVIHCAKCGAKEIELTATFRE